MGYSTDGQRKLSLQNRTSSKNQRLAASIGSVLVLQSTPISFDCQNSQNPRKRSRQPGGVWSIFLFCNLRPATRIGGKSSPLENSPARQDTRPGARARTPHQINPHHLCRDFSPTKTDTSSHPDSNSSVNTPSSQTIVTTSGHWQETTPFAPATTSPSHPYSLRFTWAHPHRPPSIATLSTTSSSTAAYTLTTVPPPSMASLPNTSSLLKQEADASHNSYSSHNKASGPSHPTPTLLE
jgi:hypothetical protein